MAAFKRLNQVIKHAAADKETSESKFWRQFKSKNQLSLTHPPVAIDFSPVDPNQYVICSSTHAVLYNASKTHLRDNGQIRQFSLKNNMYSAKFRSDGRLLVASGERPEVRVFYIDHKSELHKRYLGHQAAVHTCMFGSDNIHVFSGSDDKTARFYDLPSEECLNVFTGHSDYIRSCDTSAANGLWVTGSYDHSCKIWDPRCGNECLYTLQHGSPVESVLMLPGGGAVASAGGNTVKIWDVLSGGKLLHTIADHSKTVTALSFDGSQTRLLTGGLDQFVKVHNLRDFECSHTMKVDAPVLSLGVSKDNTRIAIGTTASNVILKVRNVSKAESRNQQTQATLASQYKFLMRGQNVTAEERDFKIGTSRQRALTKHDKELKSFNYAEALNRSLESGDPATIVSLLDELEQRCGLEIALGNRDDSDLEPILTFVVRHITSPIFSATLSNVATIILDIYSEVVSDSVEVSQMLYKLRNKLREEVRVQNEFFSLLGVMDTILAPGQSRAKRNQSKKRSASTTFKENMAVPASKKS
eukprot:TRINITY_DN3333_c0_g2_i1.p1 TRINITY_DN3333_c0_g2~~TRINITY_DN3333_c0_g2_i1.p1  ORF type:complete len:529 (-),score=145.37 TRINITY_DN3333_c0_g2_i1:1129-2715(-)